MKVLGSTGIDIADAGNPKYIEIAGEFVPGVTSNITTTALTKANADAMKAVIEKAGGAVLYGEKETTFGKTNSETGGGISESGSGAKPTGLEADILSFRMFKEPWDRLSHLKQIKMETQL